MFNPETLALIEHIQLSTVINNTNHKEAFKGRIKQDSMKLQW